MIDLYRILLLLLADLLQLSIVEDPTLVNPDLRESSNSQFIHSVFILHHGLLC